MNVIGRRSYRCQFLPRHQVHHEHKEASKLYERTLEHTKKQHWRDWLEKAKEPDIWTVHKALSASASDGGKARILALKYKQGDEELIASDNAEKA